MRRLHVLLLGCLLGSCDDKSGSPSVDYAPLLAALTDQVALPAFAHAATTADALSTALHALEASPSADTLHAAQDAWRQARAAFRALDALHFGPIDDLGIGARIDFSPARTADIDAVIAGSGALDAQTVADAGGGSKGYLAVAYLLFGTSGGDAARKHTYARLLGDEIAASVHTLADTWTQDFADALKTAGAGSTRYASQRAALDDYVAGVAFSLELVVGVRLALPLGRKAMGTPMPSVDPTPWSDSAVADMNAALVTASALYRDPGFSTRIRPKSAVLDDRCLAQFDDCIAKITAIAAPFVTSVANDTATVQDAYNACKTLKATWNTDATSALGATLKPTDNDGD